ncbi:3'-5' exonuclease [Sphingomonas sp. NPDC079357]|uniref:3'-5' exonuclease n=1 Tax=Sphingomonas sp. NPDC079357 TaxID=3364518 RepID=UPI0038506E8B
MMKARKYQPSADQLERAAALLDAHPGYRVTRALPPPASLALPEPIGKVRTALVVDTETTSLDWKTGKIIQVAALPVAFDAKARIVGVGETRSWLEDPGEPLTPAIIRLTGLTDGDVAGQRIHDAAIEQMLDEAVLIVAHNARFDRAWWEARWAVARAKPWACSLAEIDWRGHGYEGRSLGVLLDQAAGWFNVRHRADADVDALVALLTATLPPGHTAFAEMLFTASKPTMRVSAIGAAFEAKDRLRLRGYRWAPDQRVWQIDIAEAAREGELAWLAAEARCRTPRLERITWFERHR